MNASDWGKRIAHRSDIGIGLVHLTKENGSLSAFQVLMKILKEKKLIAGDNQIANGKQRGNIC